MIINGLLSAKAQNHRFEPSKTPANKDKTEVFASVCPTLLRAARELRTVILNGYKSYEMEAAVKMLRGEEPFDEETMRWMERVKPVANSR